MNAENKQIFLINITILEGRHYAWSNMNSYVILKVGKQKNVTKVRPSTDNPYYNQYFVFEFKLSQQEMLDQVITLIVYRARYSCRRRKLLGYVTMDVATVWEQPDHLFYRKWAILSSPKADNDAIMGYLKVTISITRKGHVSKIPPENPFGDDDIEGNLLLPLGITTERQKALFIFKVYKGVDIAYHKSKNAMVESEDEDEDEIVEQSKHSPNSYFRVTFAGLKGRTRVCYNTSQPTWNQSLTFFELFPALCQRVKLQLNYSFGRTGYSKVVKYIQMHSIANDREHGFLPTFGPTYIHFYEKGKLGDKYVGKILVSLETMLFSEVRTRTRVVKVDKILPILEAMSLGKNDCCLLCRQPNTQSALWSYDTMMLFGVILDASVIDKRYSRNPISFELDWGPNKRRNNLNNMRETEKYMPVSRENKFWKIDFQNAFPCLHKTSVYPNARRRLYNTNLIEDIILKMKNYLEEISMLLHQSEDDPSLSCEIGAKLKQMFNYLEKACRNAREIIQETGDSLITTLDKNKMNLCLRELESIETLCATAYQERVKRKSFKRGIKFVKRLEKIREYPQECFPDVFLWMIYGGKKVSSIQIPARKLLYSTIEDECGIFCGKTTTLYFKTYKKSTSRSSTICKIDCFFWLSQEKFKSSCLNNLPKGFEVPETVESRLPVVLEEPLPSFLHLTNSITFFCRAHIYQGRFLFAFDRTGLSDFIARIIIGNQSKATKEIKASLNPIWDQTLILKDIVVYGTKEHIKENIPIVTIEITDKDKCFQSDYVGRGEVKPSIKFLKDSSEESSSRLSWCKVKNDKMIVGEVLCLIEFLEGTPSMDKISENSIVSIPKTIKPALTTYRMDVMFWGVRNLKNVYSKPMVVIECVGYKLASEAIGNIKIDQNFMEPLKFIDMDLPISEDLIPPLSIKLYDCQPFGHKTYAGTNLTLIKKLVYHPLTKDKWSNDLRKNETKSYDSLTSNFKESVSIIDINAKKYYEKPVSTTGKKQKKKRSLKQFFLAIKMAFGRKKKDTYKDIYGTEVLTPQGKEDDFIDWWTKYFVSLDEADDETVANTIRMVIYNTELESQPKFQNFTDTLDSFKIYRGKTVGDAEIDNKSVIAVLKAKIKLFIKGGIMEFVTPGGFPLEKVRIYCVRGIKLRPKDSSGKSDSYIVIKMGKTIIDDSKNFIPKNVNPIYGRCFELKGIFPKDHALSISVYDWDRHSSNDLIGETVVDLENRLYTKHRAHCGLQLEYKESGPYFWRDQRKPTEILENLCKRYNLDPPRYTGDSVYVGFKTISPLRPEDIEKNSEAFNRERMALYVLHHWNEMPVVGYHLVPDHVETRSLYNPKTPGIEQGKLQLWIDIFPLRDLPAPIMVNIKPRKAVSYELRITIWNTEEVILNEDDFFGDRKSDIYIKGWMYNPQDAQTTDVHYRSLTGEGNFNWRFVFKFDYLITENKMVVKTKESFSSEETELKVPCKIRLQVWDNDIFSADDFLGSLAMDLNKMPRGPNNSKKCSLAVLEAGAPKIDLFKIKRTRGWWPFRANDEKSQKKELTGKLEAEFELLTADEAALNPAGLGRSAPQALPPPNRPASSFSWISNPLKTCKYIIWKNLKYKLLKFIIIALILLLLGLGIYNVPGYSVKKILGA